MNEYEFEVWQGATMKAGGTVTNPETALDEAEENEMIYGGDGPVTLKFYERRELTRDEMKAIVG